MHQGTYAFECEPLRFQCHCIFMFCQPLEFLSASLSTLELLIVVSLNAGRRRVWGPSGAQNAMEFKCTGLPVFRGASVHLILVMFSASAALLEGPWVLPGPSWGVWGILWTVKGGPWGSCCCQNIDRNIDRNPLWFLSIFLSIFGRPRVALAVLWGPWGARQGGLGGCLGLSRAPLGVLGSPFGAALGLWVGPGRPRRSVMKLSF